MEGSNNSSACRLTSTSSLYKENKCEVCTRCTRARKDGYTSDINRAGREWDGTGHIFIDKVMVFNRHRQQCCKCDRSKSTASVEGIFMEKIFCYIVGTIAIVFGISGTYTQGSSIMVAAYGIVLLSFGTPIFRNCCYVVGAMVIWVSLQEIWQMGAMDGVNTIT
jgi:hypothetical protein